MGHSQLNKSFFFGVDSKFGWGNVSYFTFFSEFNRPWRGVVYIESSFMTILFVLSIIGNVFFLGFILKSKYSRTITNYFVCNLALADVMFSTSAPFIAYIRITDTWRLGDGMCHLLNYGMFICGFVMIWTMAVISIDRYVCINLNVSSAKRMKPRHVIIICVCIWVIASLLFLPIALYFHLKDINIGKTNITFCTLLWPISNFQSSLLFTCFLLLLAFFAPFLIIVVNYFRIFKKFWASKRAIASTSLVISRNSSTRDSRRSRNMRIVKTLVLLVVLFVLMWAPLFLTFGLIQYDATYTVNVIPSHALVWTVVVAYLNSCVNPFLYGFINSELQRGLMACCNCCRSEETLVRGNRLAHSFSVRSDNTVHM